MKNHFKKCINAVTCLTPCSTVHGEVVTTEKLPLSQDRRFLCHVCESLSLDIFGHLGCYIPQIVSKYVTDTPSGTLSVSSSRDCLTLEDGMDKLSRIVGNCQSVLRNVQEERNLLTPRRKPQITHSLSLVLSKKQLNEIQCVIKTNEMHFSLYGSISRYMVQKMWKKSKTSYPFSVRFTLIFTKTYKCVHMFIKVLYTTFPLLVAWRKWYPYMCFLFLPSTLHRCLGQGCTNTGRQVARGRNFLPRRLMCLNSQCGICFISPLWRLEFWGDF